MVYETLITAIKAQFLHLFKFTWGMLLVARELYFYLSIFWSLICVAECGKCPLDGVHRQVDFDACSSYKSNYNGLKNTFCSYFSLNYALGHQKRVPVTQSEDVCCSSELSYFSCMLYGQNSEAQCSRTGIFDVNRSVSRAASPEESDRQHVDVTCSSDCHTFHLPDGGTITCSLNYRELGHESSFASANNFDDIVLSSCGGHLPHQEETSFILKNSEIGKSQFSDSSSPHVRITPNKLDWGQKYLYHPSVAYLRIQNTCNESVLKVYEPFSTNRQFYPFNTSEVVLGPGEATTISFVFSPKWLGLSSAELILQTSFGGFLVKAQGLAVESPHRLRPLEGLGVSSGGWLSRKLPLLNPFNDSIHLKEVTAWFAVYGSSSTLLAESFCSKQDLQETNKHTFADPRMLSSVKSGKFDSLVMEIRPISNWIIDPYETESILEMAFSPGSEGQVLGAICMQLVRPLEGETDTLVIPFEAELNRTATGKNTSLLSVTVEAVGCCDVNETSLSVLVRNNALHLVKILKISEVLEMKKRLQIKYSEGLLLLPGTVTHIALVTYESSQVKYDSRTELDEINMGCMLQILTNDTISPILEIPCREMFVVCSRQQQESLNHQLGNVDFGNRKTEFSTSSGNLPFLNGVMMSKILVVFIFSMSFVLLLLSASYLSSGDTEVDEFVLRSWQSQRTMGGLYVLDDHELLFPTVLLGRYFAKSITVRNPSQEPIILQLILDSRETMDNCRTSYDNLPPPSSNNYIFDSAAGPSKYGFSLVHSAVTEAYLHPYGSAILGPIFFHPSNRCDWKSLALIRNNLSGVELLSLHGRGGSLSLALFEGLEHVHRLDFNTNLLFPPNMFPPDISPNNRDVSSSCRRLLSKKLLAVNSGDFPVMVQRIHVSGTECGLDGFTVHNCKAFSLEPGESVELGISYQPDFSASLVYRDLELMLAAGILVIPMKASLPLYVLNVCRKSIFWVRVKNCCLAVVLASILMSLLFWFVMPHMVSSSSLDYLVKDGRTCNSVGRPKGKSSSLNCNKGNGKPFASTKKVCLKSVQRDDEPANSFLTYSKCQHGDLKPERIDKLTNSVVEGETEKALQSDAPAPKETGSSPHLLMKSVPVESAGKFEAGQPVSLTVKTQKDKKRRPRKRKGAGSGLTTVVEVSSSQSGNSTPSSPLSPFTAISSEEMCYSSLRNRKPHDSPSPFGVTEGSCNKDEEPKSGLKVTDIGPESVGCANVSGNCSEKSSFTQPQLTGHRKRGNRPMLLPSATFPGMGTRSCPSRLAISPHARAPGPGPKLQKAVEGLEAEEQKSSDDSLTYDIWGNHFSGLHLTSKPNDPPVMTSEAVECNPDSFFLRGPRQTLLTNDRPRSVSTSSYEQG